MTKRLLAALLILATPALAEKSAVDAFFGTPAKKKLPDVRRLSPAAQVAAARSAVSAVEPRLGVPKFLWAAPQRAKTSLVSLNVKPEEAARRYLAQYAELYRASYKQIAAANVSNVHDLHDGTAVIVTFQQRVGDVRVFRDEVHVVMNARLDLVAISGYLTPATRPEGQFKLSAATALTSAAKDLTDGQFEAHLISEQGLTEGGYTRFGIKTSRTPARTRPVYFPMPDGLVPGFYVELKLPEAGYFSYVVSAATGEVLYRHNLSAHASYRVWADTAAPHRPLDGPQGTDATPYPFATMQTSGYDPGHVAQSVLTIDNIGADDFSKAATDPWLPAGATQTHGNNVYAYADIGGADGYDTGDVVGTSSSQDSFEYVYDFDAQPNANLSQQKAAVTQLFFNTNFFHDWYYDLGFDEVSGNAQADNKGRGGLGNDELLAEGQDFSGTDNANMQTPSDGEHPIMQMYLFLGNDEATVTLNPVVSGFDAGVVRNPVGAEFGQQSYDVTAPVALVNDGVATTVTVTNPFNGNTSTFVTTADGCDPTPWVGDYTGKIVVLDRGLCTFVAKAQNAQDAGALGVLIANNTNGGYGGDLTGSANDVTIPVMGISQSSGRTIKGDLDAGTLASASLHRLAALSHDGTIDNGVVAHEWGHFISNRLVNDGNGFESYQDYGLQEGIADFHAVMLIVREGDDQRPGNANWNGSYGLAGWAGAAADPQAYYWGFRRYPISSDFAKNPLTFQHISDGVDLPATPVPAFSGDNSEPHNTGELWAVTMWEVYSALLRDGRRDFPTTQHLMRQYVISSYKAMPTSPDFTQARDAVLSVMLANDMTDYTLAWHAFAKRGLGMGAVAPPYDSQTNSPLTESFDVGNDVTITAITLDDAANSCDNDGVLDGNESGTLHIEVSNIGVGTLSAATVSVAVSSDTAAFTFDNGDSIALPEVAPFSSTSVDIPVSLAALTGKQNLELSVSVADDSLLHGARTQPVTFAINNDISYASTTTDDVEAPTSWTATEDTTLTEGETWRIAEEDGNHFWLATDVGAPSDLMLTSAPLIIGTDPLTITFRHRYSFEPVSQGDYYDGSVIEVQDSSGSWTDVGQYLTGGYTGTIYSGTGQNASANPLTGRQGYVGSSAGYPAFINETLSLGTQYAGQTIKLRFRAGSDDAEGADGWDIDDIVVTGATNTPFNQVLDDANSCAAPTNHPPDITMPASLAADAGGHVSIDAVVTDPDGDTVTTTWSFDGITSPTVNGNSVSFTAPTADALTVVVRATITATDGHGGTRLATTLVTVTNPSLANKKKGCGCTSGFDAVPLLGLMLMLRARRRRS